MSRTSERSRADDEAEADALPISVPETPLVLANTPIPKPRATRDADGKVKLNYRVDVELRADFDASARLGKTTSDDLIARLMRDHVEAHRA